MLLTGLECVPPNSHIRHVEFCRMSPDNVRQDPSCGRVSQIPKFIGSTTGKVFQGQWVKRPLTEFGTTITTPVQIWYDTGWGVVWPTFLRLHMGKTFYRWRNTLQAPVNSSSEWVGGSRRVSRKDWGQWSSRRVDQKLVYCRYEWGLGVYEPTILCHSPPRDF